MKRLLSFALVAALTAALAASLTACDYNNTPGKDPQASQDFTNAPKATATETNLDSISGSQEVHTPIGKGSAADQQTSVDAALDAAPGNSPTSTMPQTNTEARASTREE
ncbi:hypothetical protein [Hymenobacter rubripertinctus]|uniref:Uncharacterized protein n=1 Tax=Hymenobacter rubripertinctus TaxID=2029981 RepID=A0A418R419_9BACT|nr:hypothetical protein [Hymenobacter rubripertinctus]RIY12136.1 hypothetical protein D0T11_05680 [Hymenobacter rubripertinctus]